MATDEQKKVAVNKLEAFNKSIDDFLNSPDNQVAKVFQLAEKYTRVPRKYMLFGLIGVLVVYLIVGQGTGILVNFIGFLYPAYKSCKAIDSVEKDDDTQWLTYWVVYAFFGLLETFTDLLLFWIPFYFIAKCAFLIWCMIPIERNGAAVLYNNVIKPFVQKHEHSIDDAIDVGGQLAMQAGGRAVGAAMNAAGNMNLQQVQQIQQTLASGTDESNKKDD